MRLERLNLGRPVMEISLPLSQDRPCHPLRVFSISGMFEIFLRRFAWVTMPKKLRARCFRGRQRQSEQVPAGLPNTHHQDSLDHAYHACTGASPPVAAARRTICLAAASDGLAPVRA